MWQTGESGPPTRWKITTCRYATLELMYITQCFGCFTTIKPNWDQWRWWFYTFTAHIHSAYTHFGNCTLSEEIHLKMPVHKPEAGIEREHIRLSLFACFHICTIQLMDDESKKGGGANIWQHPALKNQRIAFITQYKRRSKSHSITTNAGAQFYVLISTDFCMSQ